MLLATAVQAKALELETTLEQVAPKAVELATNPVPVAPMRKKRNPRVAAETDMLARSMRASVNVGVPTVVEKNPFFQKLA